MDVPALQSGHVKQEPGHEEEQRTAAVGEFQTNGTASSSQERTMASEAVTPGQSHSPGLDLSWSSLDSSLAGGEGFPLSVGRRHGDHCEERASRPGNSRIPGRDHRRYYHNHWRLEYLMDFNPRCHSMICMVCGSSLATLKLSTIKRHIHQKHPYSVNWTLKEKETIITSWDAHLRLQAQTQGEESEGIPDSLQTSPGDLLPGVRKRRRSLPPVTKRSRLSTSEEGKMSNDAGNLDQYLNESLQNWFRVEFMMDYNSQKNKLFCMMCGSMLPNLNLEDIKQHILDSHPKSLDFSEEEKNIILGAWRTKTMLEQAVQAQDDDGEQTEEEEDGEEEEGTQEDQQDDEVQEFLSTATVYKVEKVSPTPTPISAPAPVSTPAPVPFPSLAPVTVCAPAPVAILTPVRIPVSAQAPVTLSSFAAFTVTPSAHISVPAQLFVISTAPAPVVPSAHVDLTLDESDDETPTETPPCNGQESFLHSTSNLQQSPGDVTWVDTEPSMSDMMPGKGRGRDHRRYYQERWRMEYLMDYNCLTHGLVCMVCGSSLNTLKLSTIKRHIHQKHPDTVFLSDLEKSVIIEEWNNKITQMVGPRSSLQDPSEVPSVTMAENGIHVEKQAAAPQDVNEGPAPQDVNEGPAPQDVNEGPAPQDVNEGPAPQDVNEGPAPQDVNQGPAPQDVNQGPAPQDLNQGPAPQDCRQGRAPKDFKQAPVPQVFMQEPSPKDFKQEPSPRDFKPAPTPQDFTTQANTDTPAKHSLPEGFACSTPKASQSTSSTDLSVCEDGIQPASWDFCFGKTRGRGGRDQQYHYQDRWRLEYLMDYNRMKNGLVCMVCECPIPSLKLGTIKMHIQQKHPDTTFLSDQEKAVIMEEWNQKMALLNRSSLADQGVHPEAENEICVEISDDPVQQYPPSEPVTKRKTPKKPKLAHSAPAVVEPPDTAACSSYPFRNQRRNYQVRWRTDYMMDYDCRRHGLICMVCGGTLATLKVSTIKRHIVQVHPYSVDFSPEERQRILDAYSEMALHYIHSDECFKQSQREPGLPHHSHPACGSIAGTGSAAGTRSVAGTDPYFSAAQDDVIVI